MAQDATVEALQKLESRTLAYLQATAIKTWRAYEKTSQDYREKLGGLLLTVNRKMSAEGNGRRGMGFRAWLGENGIPSSTAYLMIDDYMLSHDLKKPGRPRLRKAKRTLSRLGQGAAVNSMPAALREMKEALAEYFERLDAGVRRDVARHLLDWLDENFYGGEYGRSGMQGRRPQPVKTQVPLAKTAA